MREVRLSEWRRSRTNQRRMSPEFEEWAKQSVKRRPSRAEELTNSVRYIRMKKRRLIERGILYQVSERNWRLVLRRR